MKMAILSFILFIAGFNVQAATNYCKLQNAPQVKAALAQALDLVNAENEGVAVKGGPIQFVAWVDGEVWNYRQRIIMVFELDGLAQDNVTAVAVQVVTDAFMAKDYFAEETAAGTNPQSTTCSDTGEVNAEMVYIDQATGDSEIRAMPFSLN